MWWYQVERIVQKQKRENKQNETKKRREGSLCMYKKVFLLQVGGRRGIKMDEKNTNKIIFAVKTNKSSQ
jgi:hypothetical protein